MLRRIRAEWKERSPPAVERLRQPNNPQCSRSHLGNEGTRNGATDQQTMPRIQHPSGDASWIESYSSLRPVNPHMNSISAGAETFGTRNGNRRPRLKDRAFVENIASQYPDINRPQPVQHLITGRSQEGLHVRPPVPIRPSLNAESAESAVENAMGRLNYVAVGREMGFEVGLMKRILTRFVYSERVLTK